MFFIFRFYRVCWPLIPSSKIFKKFSRSRAKIYLGRLQNYGDKNILGTPRKLGTLKYTWDVTKTGDTKFYLGHHHIFSYTSDKWKNDYAPTIFDRYTFQVQIDGRDYSLEILDTAGQGTWFHLLENPSSREIS